MAGRIDYDIEKYQFTEAGESPRLRAQRCEVYLECCQQQVGVEERLRTALLNVDYVTSFELPPRLLLVRAPQLIADARDQLQLSCKAAVSSGKRYGRVYSLKQDLQLTPGSFHYHLSDRIRHVDLQGPTIAPYQQIVREIKSIREWLRHALLADLPVIALGTLFWSGNQWVVTDIAQLCRSGMGIVTEEVEASDNLFNTIRRVPVYRLTSKRYGEPSSSRCFGRQLITAPSNQTHYMLPICRGAGPSHALAMSVNSTSPSGIMFIFSTTCHPLHFSSLQDSGRV